MAKRRKNRRKKRAPSPSMVTHAVPATFRTAAPPEPLQGPRIDRTRNYYAVRVMTGREREVAQRLKRRRGAVAGLAIECPLMVATVIRKDRTRQDRLVEVVRSALPGYVVAGVDPEEVSADLTRILDTPDVLGVVRSAVDYRPIGTARVQAYLDDLEGVVLELTKPPEPIKAGDRVRVLSGSFANFSGPVTGVDEAGIAAVDVAMFGRVASINIAVSELELLPPEPEVGSGDAVA